MPNQTGIDWLTQTKNDVFSFSTSRMYEIIASVVFLVLITQGRRTWVNVQIFLQLVEGLFICFFTERYINILVRILFSDNSMHPQCHIKELVLQRKPYAFELFDKCGVLHIKIKNTYPRLVGFRRFKRFSGDLPI